MQSSYSGELCIGEKIAGRYEILSCLGKGSMGVIYKARHDLLGRIVAIKTLQIHQITDEKSAKRFEREAKASSRMEHPNLVSVHDFGASVQGIPYLVMDYVEGVSLYEVLKQEGHLTCKRAVSIFTQVCDGLHHAHKQGVIHRDLKPANILLTSNDMETVKVVDLGIAKIIEESVCEAEVITGTGEVCGSPIYLSPEQCTHGTLDPRTDIYSLGVCLYESLAGMPPIRGQTVYDTLYMHVHENPQLLREAAPECAIPEKLEEVVLRCLAKEPDHRYKTVLELKQALTNALKPNEIIVLPPEQLFAGLLSKATFKQKAAVKQTKLIKKQTLRTHLHDLWTEHFGSSLLAMSPLEASCISVLITIIICTCFFSYWFPYLQHQTGHGYKQGFNSNAALAAGGIKSNVIKRRSHLVSSKMSSKKNMPRVVNKTVIKPARRLTDGSSAMALSGLH